MVSRAVLSRAIISRAEGRSPCAPMKGAEGPGRVGERITVCSGAAEQRRSSSGRCSGAAVQGGAAAQQFRAVQRRSAPRHRPAAPPLARAASSRASTATSRRPACGCSRPPARASSPGAPEDSFQCHITPQAAPGSGQPRPISPSATWAALAGHSGPVFDTAARRQILEPSSSARVERGAATRARGCHHVPEGLRRRVFERAAPHELRHANLRAALLLGGQRPVGVGAEAAEVPAGALRADRLVLRLRVLRDGAPVVRGASLHQGRRDGASQRQRRLVRR
eukprot:scaffold31546_cov66-Phaeocystis_antarctica.AAC.12